MFPTVFVGVNGIEWCVIEMSIATQNRQKICDAQGISDR